MRARRGTPRPVSDAILQTFLISGRAVGLLSHMTILDSDTCSEQRGRALVYGSGLVLPCAQRNGGSALVVSCLLMGTLMALGASMLGGSLHESRTTQRAFRLDSGFYLAEAGLDDAIRWMRTQPAPPSGTARFDPFGAVQGLGSGTYAVVIDPDDNNLTSYLDLYTITATGQVAGDTAASRRVAATLRTEAFARYSYFTDTETMSNGTRIWFTSSDHLQGPVHSNSQFNVAGSPVFDGPVSSAAATINDRNPPPAGGNHPQFNGGLTLGAQDIQLPLSATALRVAAASAGGQWYTGNTMVVMKADAVSCSPLPPPCELITNALLGWTNQPRPLPANGAIFVNGGNATVSGVLDGQLTIGSSHNVIINNNVLCADSPASNSASNDIVGLVAERNVVVASAAPNDLQIQASILALDSSFAVENWWVGPPKGTLSVYGGMIQKRRGAVGTFSSATGQLLSGYAKDYRYDSRLLNMAPPFYPTTADFRLVLWQDLD